MPESTMQRERLAVDGGISVVQAGSRSAVGRILRPGRNCSGLYLAARASYLVDGRAIFAAVREAMLKARQQIWIIGWELDSQMELLVGDDARARGDDLPVRLGEFLCALAERSPELRINVLGWDYHLIYARERERGTRRRLQAFGLDRLRCAFDSSASFLGSHHQKIVVIDDSVAFSGGLDLTRRRWDTREHRGVDGRRADSKGESYGPFHDVQIAVDGEAAQALGALARRRWSRATGETPAACKQIKFVDAWPASAPDWLRNRQFAISVTDTAGGGAHDFARRRAPARFEVERLFLDSIRAARRSIYVENQYFTSARLARALARRLGEPDGPEVVMILPRDQTGWIEEHTMGALRDEALRIVEAGDRWDRFRCYYPVKPAIGAGYVKVHSKVMTVDDRFARIGSANLNGRSMGLDSECDVSFEASDAAGREAVARLRGDLLSEHLGCKQEEFESRAARHGGSLVRAADSFLREDDRRRFVRLRPRPASLLTEALSPSADLLDPAGPYRPAAIARRSWRRAKNRLGEGYGPLKTFAVSVVAIAFAAALLGAAEAPGGASSGADRLATLAGSPAAPIAALLAFVLATLAFAPVLALIAAVGATFPPEQAAAISLGGMLISSALGYALAARAATALGRRHPPALSKWLSFSEKLEARVRRGPPGSGWATVAMIRMLPIAPFSIVNMLAGSMRIRFADFMVGSLIGALPGVLGMTAIAGLAARGWSRLAADGNGGIQAALWFAAAAASIYGALRLARRWRAQDGEDLA